MDMFRMAYIAEELTYRAILMQGNCACPLDDELEKYDSKDTAGQEVLVVEADECLRAP